MTMATLSAASSNRWMAAAKRLRCLLPKTCTRPATIICWSSDYALAEQVFADYLANNPEDPRAADAMFWLGEAQYSQGHYQDSAKTFLDAHKQFPRADKGPDALLKLGMSLAKLDNRETACATLREVLIRYPGASAAVRAKVSEEQQLASC
ncbi:tol-pal system protein YbgF [Hoeflea alexandrii]|uniref:tol-pal system protein YbgF n=1 Tax=Hoeflea alexandrii TaxID=288436 RepID=UPI002D1E460D|nr:tol-pal system protein YbgF [Hoeflea alexandrii]